MNCNCKWCEVVLGLIILIAALASWPQWITIVAAAILIIHAFACKNCGTCAPEAKPAKGKKKK